ncbi:hypothetical protein IMZ48_15775 [Candidatus Bathyarchaeota archaeon]|nr:hypothetical protein [Candidatus Bathyarchaeota archaeon]
MSQLKRKYEEDHEKDRAKDHKKKDRELAFSLYGDEFQALLYYTRATGSAVSKDVRSIETPYSFKEALERNSKWLEQDSTISKDFAFEGNSISYHGSIEEHGSTISKDVALERTSVFSQSSIGEHASPATQQSRPSGPRTADSLNFTTPRYTTYDVALGRNIVSHGSTEERASSYTQQNRPPRPSMGDILNPDPGRSTYNNSRRRYLPYDSQRMPPARNVYDSRGMFPRPYPSPARQPGASAPENNNRGCVACREAVEPSRLVLIPCSHEYCHGCLAEVFKVATTSLFPPRCCNQRIPIDAYKSHLPPDLVAKVKAKEAEHRTPNRTYCHACSALIPPATSKGNTATCPACRAWTCVSCKGKTHLDACPEDRGSQEVLRIASKQGWMQCPRCSSMVEQTYGCEHMSKTPHQQRFWKVSSTFANGK